jgi:NADH-ubiquinone oxidoreductase chain 5
MGNLVSQNPVTASRILVANIALCGLPFLAGFYSKDLIIEYILIGGFNSLMVIITLVAVGFTALYSIRFSIILIWGPQNYLPSFYPNDNPSTTAPIVIIALISISIGSSIL